MRMRIMVTLLAVLAAHAKSALRWGRGRAGATCAAGLLCAAWYALSSASSVVGALTLAELPRPLTLALAQLAGAAGLSAPALALAGVRPAPPLPAAFVWRALAPLAFAKFAATVFFQVSIWKVPVSYAHTVKATTPLWTAALSWALLGERVSRRVAGALLVIAAGVGVASATEMRFDALGLGAALAAAASAAGAVLSLQHIYSKRLLRDHHAMHYLRLLQILSVMALVPLTPLWLAMDAPTLAGARPAGGWGGALTLLAAAGALAWLQAVAAFSVLSRVSLPAFGVASAAKRAAVVGASLLLLRNPAPPLNLAGMALAAAGVLLYNRAKHADRRDAAARPPLPV